MVHLLMYELHDCYYLDSIQYKWLFEATRWGLNNRIPIDVHIYIKQLDVHVLMASLWSKRGLQLATDKEATFGCDRTFFNRFFPPHFLIDSK